MINREKSHNKAISIVDKLVDMVDNLVDYSNFTVERTVLERRGETC